MYNFSGTTFEDDSGVRFLVIRTRAVRLSKVGSWRGVGYISSEGIVESTRDGDEVRRCLG